jgi:hypothetical protein
MKFGLLYEDEVVDVFTPPAGKTINDCMQDDRASEYVSIPDYVTVGYTQRFDGTWISPVTPIKS